jgi:tryptophan synthase alpha chain
VSGPERIAGAFRASGKRAALMPYLMGGFPDQETSLAIGRAYAEAGADLVELGIPFSDPLADGPVIHGAGTKALAAGATVEGVLEVCSELSKHVTVVVMCYANLVIVRTPERFAEALTDAGASGLIVPDLPFEEAPQVLGACDTRGVALVPLVAPTTPDERFAKIGERARGFLYTVSVTGITGERSSADFHAVVGRAKQHTDVPVAIGFGISTPDQASAAADAGADGVIVGSRLVRAAEEADDPAGAVGELVGAMSAALR